MAGTPKKRAKREAIARGENPYTPEQQARYEAKQKREIERRSKMTDLELQIEDDQKLIYNHWRKLAKKLAKAEAFVQAHQQVSAELFADKIALIHTMLDSLKTDGHLDQDKVKRAEARKLDIIFSQIGQLEKSAGFGPTKKTETSVTFTLADAFKRLQQGDLGDEIIDAQIIVEDDD